MNIRFTVRTQRLGKIVYKRLGLGFDLLCQRITNFVNDDLRYTLGDRLFITLEGLYYLLSRFNTLCKYPPLLTVLEHLKTNKNRKPKNRSQSSKRFIEDGSGGFVAVHDYMH